MNNEMNHQLQKDLHQLERETASNDLFRLAQLRNNALKGKRPTSSRQRLVWPAMAATAASLLIAVFMFGPMHPAEQSMPVVNEKLIFEESVDLYEDLDFYYWMAEAEDQITG